MKTVETRVIALSILLLLVAFDATLAPGIINGQEAYDEKYLASTSIWDDSPAGSNFYTEEEFEILSRLFSSNIFKDTFNKDLFIKKDLIWMTSSGCLYEVQLYEKIYYTEIDLPGTGMVAGLNSLIIFCMFILLINGENHEKTEV
jgi:hypothetical protein